MVNNMPQAPTIPRICLRCGKDFLATAYEVKRGRAQVCGVRCANGQRRQTPEGWKARRRNKRLTDPAYRRKDRARDILIKAVRNGTVTRKPCEVCGTMPVDAHHDNYDEPLDVRWFCRKHHLELERELKAGLTR